MKHRKVTSTKGGWDHQDMIRAVDEVIKKTLSERKAAELYHVKRSSLKRRVKEARTMPCGLVEARAKPYHKSSMKIFTAAEEKQLVEYCLRASKMGYGLSPLKLRALAYEYAEKLKIRLPHSRRGRPNPWETNKQAGKDWFRAFLCRHKELSIRKPEVTSIGPMSAFNKHNVEIFYINVREVLTKYKFQPNNIWNCDETGVTTVQIPEHVIAGKGERQVASVTSAERGTLVTMCNAVNACGSSVPPFYIFPRVRFTDVILRNAAPGCAGTAQLTGWMVEATFIEWFRNFINCIHPCKENPILLILDNHETHMSIEFIDLAAANGVVVVTIPPHTSHKLQPLDISVYGPFKRLYNREIDSWLVTHPGKTVSIYDIAEISGRAWIKASMPANIISGFAASGLYPFQPDKWQDEDFSLAQVTDRPNPDLNNSQPTDSQSGIPGSGDPCQLRDFQSGYPLPSDSNSQPIPSSPSNPQPGDAVRDTGVLLDTLLQPTNQRQNDQTTPQHLSPQPSTSTGGVTPAGVRPLPKAQAREPQRKGGRKKLSSTILTSTPVKESIRANQRAKNDKKQLVQKRKAQVTPPKRIQKNKKPRTEPASSDDDDAGVDLNKLCIDSSDNEDDDDGNDQASAKPVRRKINKSLKSASDNCVVCGEVGKDKELWYRCRVCSFWAHEACTDATCASRYICDFCKK